MKHMGFKHTPEAAVLVNVLLHTLPVRRFTVEEYHRMGQVGLLGEDERVELIDGWILTMRPIGSRHAACVSLLNRVLRPVEATAIVRVEDPIILNDATEPQPDIAVVKFKANLYADAHPGPEDMLLLIEVAETSLEEDREVKLPRYAASAIPEVWIVNLVANIIEVYREPLILANGTPGYRSRTDVLFGEPLRPQAFVDVEIQLSIPLGV
jgi:Uma2 family endonuclease